MLVLVCRVGDGLRVSRFSCGGHGQRRQRGEGGGEQPPQLQGTVGSFDRFTFVIINKFSLNFMLVLA